MTNPLKVLVLLRESAKRGDEWRTIMREIERRNAAELEVLKKRHACEVADAYHQWRSGRIEFE